MRPLSNRLRGARLYPLETHKNPRWLFPTRAATNPVGRGTLVSSRLPPKRFLIGHGSDDVEVPVGDARALHSAADGRAELRVIQGAGHWLRADPRMVATLLGWLDRHR